MVLGIETSCDETAVGLVHKGKILADRTTRQILHELYGGVVPELSSRAHHELLNTAVRALFNYGAWGIYQLEAISVTSGP
ncbi:MAG: tRNA (adenosine(37)-N6)-threonylcarbamoyltransferase complex transferase subunit TsaD, partial [bacterium]